MASETWFLLRGLTREKAHWGDFAPALAAALPEADVHLLDLPGAGDRHAEAWTGGVADALAVLHAEAARLAPPTPGVRRFVFGVSLGGMVALEWAARYPDELTGVVVGNSSAGDLSPWWRRMQPGALPTILRGAVERDPRRREAAVVRRIVARRDLWERTAASWAEIQRARPVSRRNARAQLVAATRWRAPRALRVPALFLVGDGDRLVHPSCTRALAARFAAPLRVHPEAGHDITTDAGAWVVDELGRWRDALA